jgi:6-phosphogluconolactonase (cycloisomerase 2 family)
VRIPDKQVSVSGAGIVTPSFQGEPLLMKFSWRMKFSWLATGLGAMALAGLAGCGSSAIKTVSSTDTMYVASRVPGAVWGYHANFNDGSLTNIGGSPFAAQRGANAIVIDPSHSFAYVASGFGTAPGAITSYSFDLNGSMIKVGTQTVGVSPVAVAMDGAGKFLFVANRDSNSISVFSVGANAALTAVPNSPFPVTSPVSLVASPANNILFVADQSDGWVWALQIGANGTLSSNPMLPPVFSGNMPSGLAINAAGTFLYVPNQGSENVTGFTIATGAPDVPGTLSIISGSNAAGLGPAGAAVDPSGQFLYVVDKDSNQVSGYRIRPGTGTLTALTNSPYSSGPAPDAIAISPTNKFLYVSNSADSSLSTYKIDPSTGNLIPASGAIPTGSQPGGIAFGK